MPCAACQLDFGGEIVEADDYAIRLVAAHFQREFGPRGRLPLQVVNLVRLARPIVAQIAGEPGGAIVATVCGCTEFEGGAATVVSGAESMLEEQPRKHNAPAISHVLFILVPNYITRLRRATAQLLICRRGKLRHFWVLTASKYFAPSAALINSFDVAGDANMAARVMRATLATEARTESFFVLGIVSHNVSVRLGARRHISHDHIIGQQFH